MMPDSPVIPRRTLSAVGRLGAMLAGAMLLACHRDRPAKYVPQEVAAVLGVQAPDIATAIAARIDGGRPPEWVTPERWKRVRSLY